MEGALHISRLGVSGCFEKGRADNGKVGLRWLRRNQKNDYESVLDGVWIEEYQVMA